MHLAKSQYLQVYTIHLFPVSWGDMKICSLKKFIFQEGSAEGNMTFHGWANLHISRRKGKWTFNSTVYALFTINTLNIICIHFVFYLNFLLSVKLNMTYPLINSTDKNLLISLFVLASEINLNMIMIIAIIISRRIKSSVHYPRVTLQDVILTFQRGIWSSEWNMKICLMTCGIVSTNQILIKLSIYIK